jgi:hypothetical protein
MGTPPPGGFVAPLQAISDPGMGANFPTSWNDRRPIGTLFLTNKDGVLNVNNPASWAFNGTTVNDWDYSTTAGIQAIQQGLIALANSCVQQLQKIHAQGIVVWDSNGEQFAGFVYFGSPNAIPWMVPEFDQVSDQFWNVFKAAGLRIGVALRADIADFHSDGTHSEDPYVSIGQAEADLDAKLSYAHDRWGCTLFYVDSNGGATIGGNEPGQAYPAQIFQYLQQSHPDCLIMPEGHYGPGGQLGPQDNYYLWTAGYGQYRNGDPGNDAADLASVPGAFMAIDISDSGIAGTEQNLISFVRNGGILMTRAWTDQHNEQEAVMSIYNAAQAAPAPVLVLENTTTGQRAIWLLKDGVLSGSFYLPTVPVEWRIAGVGDFNGDGTDDLVLENTSTGQRAIWFLQNGAVSSGTYLPTVDAQWHIAGVGDFNGGGNNDLVLENTSTGQRAIWLLKNGAVSSGTYLPTVDVQWHIAGVGDFNGDGTDDLVLENTSTGQCAIWFLKNGAVSSGTYLPTVDVQWHIAD